MEKGKDVCGYCWTIFDKKDLQNYRGYKICRKSAESQLEALQRILKKFEKEGAKKNG